MTVNEFAKEVHENAVAHGWWETARSFPEVAALIHSEVSEALEEWRDGNPATWVRSIAALPLRPAQRTFANIPELSTSGGISSSTIFSATATNLSIPRSRLRTRSIRA